jgi:hypothetical protein
MRELAPKASSALRRKRKYSKVQASDLEEAQPSLSFQNRESLALTPPNSHHHISRNVQNKIDLSQWLGNNQDDLALEVSTLIPLEDEILLKPLTG